MKLDNKETVKQAGYGMGAALGAGAGAFTGLIASLMDKDSNFKKSLLAVLAGAGVGAGLGAGAVALKRQFFPATKPAAPAAPKPEVGGKGLLTPAKPTAAGPVYDPKFSERLRGLLPMGSMATGKKAAAAEPEAAGSAAKPQDYSKTKMLLMSLIGVGLGVGASRGISAGMAALRSKKAGINVGKPLAMASGGGALGGLILSLFHKDASFQRTLLSALGGAGVGVGAGAAMVGKGLGALGTGMGAIARPLIKHHTDAETKTASYKEVDTIPASMSMAASGAGYGVIVGAALASLPTLLVSTFNRKGWRRNLEIGLRNAASGATIGGVFGGLGGGFVGSVKDIKGGLSSAKTA